MKRILPVFLISLLLFSCASTSDNNQESASPVDVPTEAVTGNTDDAIKTENQSVQNDDNTDSTDSDENSAEKSDLTTEDESESSESESSEKDENLSSDEKIAFESLSDSDDFIQNELESISDIEEPLVLELPPETEEITGAEEETENSDEESLNELIVPDIFDDFNETENTIDGSENAVPESLQNNAEVYDADITAPDNMLQINEDNTVSSENESNFTADSTVISPEKAEDDNVENAGNDKNINDNIESNNIESNQPDQNLSEISVSDDSESNDFEDSDNFEENILEPVPSRSVTLKKGEYLDVVYPGRGWVYEGTTDGSKDISYNGRKLGTANTTFTLIARKEGTKLVHFYKKDILTDTFIDDFLEIIVTSEKAASKAHKIAPEYAEIVPQRPETTPKAAPESYKTETENSYISEDLQKESSSSEKVNSQVSEIIQKSDDDKNNLNKTNSTKIENEKSETPRQQASSKNISDTKKQDSSAEETVNQAQDDQDDVIDLTEDSTNHHAEATDINFTELLEEAKKLFAEKSYEQALEKINAYLEAEPPVADEALYLQGQILESASGIQNIKKAVQSYTKLMDSYPYSKYWDKAYKRVTYLKRFYLEVR